MSADDERRSHPPLKRLHRVGVRLPDWTQGFGFRLFQGILDVVREGNEIDLEFQQPSGFDLPEVKIDENWEGDGLMVFRHTAREAKAWKKRGISVVNLSAEHPANGPIFPRVTMDNVAAGAAAARYLAGLGLRNFAYWNDPKRRYSVERLEGYRKELEAMKLPEPVVLVIPSSGFPDEQCATMTADLGWRLLANLQSPVALFAKDDISAVCAVRALHQTGQRCPEDVAVLGVANDLVYCNVTRPALSSIQFPGRVIGEQAMHLLLAMMGGEKTEEGKRVLVAPGEIVVRESTGLVDLADEVMTKAMRHIRSHVGKRAIAVEELCRTTGISRELLRQKFQATLGRSPKEEVDAQRADSLANLLRKTDMGLGQIAEMTGFPGANDLCRFFKRIKGVTVGEWKRGVSERPF